MSGHARLSIHFRWQQESSGRFRVCAAPGGPAGARATLRDRKHGGCSAGERVACADAAITHGWTSLSISALGKIVLLYHLDDRRLCSTCVVQLETGLRKPQHLPYGLRTDQKHVVLIRDSVLSYFLSHGQSFLSAS